MNDKSQVKSHSGDCHWWTYHVCDCGWLMRAHSGDFGPPSDEVSRDFEVHSANCQRATPLHAKTAEDQALIERLRATILDPPSDIQELVIKKLNLVSADGLAKAQSAIALLSTEKATLQAQLTQAHKERDKAVAACAVMRGIVEKIEGECRGHTEAGRLFCLEALATDCGRAFLDRMKEAEWLLSQPLLCKISGQSELVEWHKRYAAFKNGGAK